MTRTRYIQDHVTGKIYERDEFVPSYGEVNAPMVMADIQPYQSQVDGTFITSRSQHRSHLRQHNCIEVGNEIKAHMAQNTPKGPPPGLKETLIRAFHQRGI